MPVTALQSGLKARGTCLLSRASGDVVRCRGARR
jgi:hypothetical protein